MAGYDYVNGMSNNAVLAYRGGLFPLSKLNATRLRRSEVEITVDFAKYLAHVGAWDPSEWHHSGGRWYRKVDFYSVDDLRELLEADTGSIEAHRQAYVSARAAKRESNKNKQDFEEYGVALVSWTDFSLCSRSSRRRSRVRKSPVQATDMSFEGWVRVVHIGARIKIHFLETEEYIRKMSDNVDIVWSKQSSKRGWAQRQAYLQRERVKVADALALEAKLRDERKRERAQQVGAEAHAENRTKKRNQALRMHDIVDNAFTLRNLLASSDADTLVEAQGWVKSGFPHPVRDVPGRMQVYDLKCRSQLNWKRFEAALQLVVSLNALCRRQCEYACTRPHRISLPRYPRHKLAG